MEVNAWLGDRSIEEQALAGVVVVAAVTFALNYSSGAVEAAVAAAITGAVAGGAYYLGLRTFDG